MKKENKNEELNYENFNIFVLGYDLLQQELCNRGLDVDTAFEVCNRVYDKFLLSKYNVLNKSEYECMRDYIDDLSEEDIENLINPKNEKSTENKSNQIMYSISGFTEDEHLNEVWRSEAVWIDTPDEKNWRNIIEHFNYYCGRAMSLGWYSGYNWYVSIRRLKVYPNGSTSPEGLVLKMDKKLYQKFKNITNYPIIPSFNENLTALDDEDKYSRYELIDQDDELYYSEDGFAHQFTTCADAWEYIFQNDLVS